MTEETLEEYIERNTEGIIEPGVRALAQSYLRYGAQWQQERMYSEEEVKEFMRIYARSEGWTVNEIFEQFKKK